MKPLKDSWFLNRYLGITYHFDRPRTVCQLGRKIVTRTFMWFFVALGLSLMVGPPLVTAYNLSVMWYTGAGIDTVYDDKVATFSGLMLLCATLEVGIATIAAVVFGARWCIITADDKLRRALYKRRDKKGYYDHSYVEPETPIRDFIGDLYKRFKDKTCVMLEYQDEVDELRRREERHKKWLAEREAARAAAKALREADTSKPSKTNEKDDFDDTDSHS